MGRPNPVLDAEERVVMDTLRSFIGAAEPRFRRRMGESAVVEGRSCDQFGLPRSWMEVFWLSPDQVDSARGAAFAWLLALRENGPTVPL